MSRGFLPAVSGACTGWSVIAGSAATLDGRSAGVISGGPATTVGFVVVAVRAGVTDELTGVERSIAARGSADSAGGDDSAVVLIWTAGAGARTASGAGASDTSTGAVVSTGASATGAGGGSGEGTGCGGCTGAGCGAGAGAGAGLGAGLGAGWGDGAGGGGAGGAGAARGGSSVSGST